MNSITVQRVGAKPDQTLQIYIPLQSLKQFEVKFSPDTVLELLLRTAESNRFNLALARTVIKRGFWQSIPQIILTL